MKIKIDRKPLVNTLKALKNLSAKADDDHRGLRDIVVLLAVPQGLVLSAGPGVAFVSILIECAVEKEGTCAVSYRLFDLLKAAKDEVISLSFEKRLSISADSGFKAALTENTSVSIPAARMQEIAEGGTNNDVQLETEELINLADISNVFPPVGTLRWVQIACDGLSSINGSVQGSEYGTLENFPMGGFGVMATYTLRPDLLLSVLPFCGNNVKLGALNTANGYVMLSDPENDNWWCLMGQPDPNMHTGNS